MLNTLRDSDRVEAYRAEMGPISVPKMICDLDPIVGEYAMDPVRHRVEELFEKLGRRRLRGHEDNIGTTELEYSYDKTKV